MLERDEGCTFERVQRWKNFLNGRVRFTKEICECHDGWGVGGIRKNIRKIQSAKLTGCETSLASMINELISESAEPGSGVGGDSLVVLSPPP